MSNAGSALPTASGGTGFDRPIANALPEELRADYYRELSHCRALPENDEMLRILRAMQFLTVLIERGAASGGCGTRTDRSGSRSRY